MKTTQFDIFARNRQREVVMVKLTKHEEQWEGSVGGKYTDRNPTTDDELNQGYKDRWGRTRTELNQSFLPSLPLPSDIRILEVGCNVGNQLVCLQKMGYSNLYGIEIQKYAVELSKAKTTGLNIIWGSAFDIPFNDGFFDLVFTSGVLIHIAPGDVARAMGEIHRCTSRYIWGLEYYAETVTGMDWRGKDEMVWKQNFARTYSDLFPDLTLVREEFGHYPDSDNKDTMFLLEKAN